jgi:lipopolysaccharide export system protein LptA
LALAPLAAAADYVLPEPPAVSTGTLLRFSADHMDYEGSSTTMHLQGNVVVRQSTRTIKADELWVDTEDRSGRSKGYLYVEDLETAVASEREGEFDFDTGAGRLKKASAGHGQWRIHAKEARLSGRKRLDYLGANFTSCGVVPPHYHFHSTRLTVVPKEHLIAYNTFFFVGPVPLFYLPILYKSLDPDHLIRMKFQPGYDRRNGAFVKGTMITPHGLHNYSKVYLDWYATQGVGTGLELVRKKSQDSRGALFAYQIRENGSGFERWALVGDGYQTVFSSATRSLALQGRMQIQSDPDFNNHYNRASLLAVTPELTNNGAIVYRLPYATTRLSYSRTDASPEQIPKTPDSYKTAKYLKNSEIYPRLDVQSNSFKVWRLPWLNTLSGFADQNFAQGRGFLQRQAGGTYQATRSFNLNRYMSYTPSASYTQAWTDNIAQGPPHDVFQGRYNASNNVRFRTLVGSLDLGHSYQMRLKPDALTEDASANDHGVESNLASAQQAFRPSRLILVRAQSGYDFRVFRDHGVGFRDRVQPFVTDLIFNPRPTFNVTIRDDYSLVEGNRSLLASLLYGDELRNYVSEAVGYSKATPDTYSADTLFGLANASSTWRISGVLRANIGTVGGVRGLCANRVVAFEKQLMVTKTWHDFFTRFMFRLRPLGVREYQVHAQLYFGPGKSPKETRRGDWEAEWFPERANPALDRP